MAKDFSAFYKEVQRYFDDYTAYTLSLIKMFANDRVRELEDNGSWRSQVELYDFTTVSGQRQYTLSANTAYDTNNIISLKEPNGKQSLRNLTLKRYNEVIGDYTEEQGDAPSAYIPYTDTDFYLYPTPSAAVVISAYIRRKQVTLTADSQYFEFPDDYTRILRHGVVADIYRDRDDDRSSFFEARFIRGMDSKKANLRKNLNGSDIRLLPGSSLEI